MERDFREELAGARTATTVLCLWMQLLFDLAVSLPVQLVVEMRRDGRHALRLWAKSPWHTGFAVAALSVAIGANAGVFSVVNALLLRELTFSDPARLAAVLHFLPPHESAAQFDSWRRHSNYLQDAALYEDGDLNLGDSQPHGAGTHRDDFVEFLFSVGRKAGNRTNVRAGRSVCCGNQLCVVARPVCRERTGAREDHSREWIAAASRRAGDDYRGDAGGLRVSGRHGSLEDA